MCSFLLAAVHSERTWILNHAVRATSSRCRLPFHNATAHLELLNMVALAILHLIPHLFVAETGPAEVQGRIDSQHSLVALCCMQATFPSIFTYDGGLIDPSRSCPT